MPIGQFPHGAQQRPLVSRLMLKKDIENVVAMFAAQEPATREIITALPEILSRGLKEGTIVGGVIYETLPDGNEEFVGFTFAVFLSAVGCKKLGNETPYFNLFLLNEIKRAATPSPILLTYNDVKTANSQNGLDVFVMCWLQSGYDYHQNTFDSRVLMESVQIQTYCLKGYNINSLTLEGWSSHCEQFILAGFCHRLIWDFAQVTANNFALTSGNSGFDPDKYLQLDADFQGRLRAWCLREEHGAGNIRPGLQEVFQNPGNAVCAFTIKQKRTLLLQAFGGLDDQGVADEDSVTQAAIRQRWQGISSRYAMNFPVRAENDARISRESILAFIRQNPVEIRP